MALEPLVAGVVSVEFCGITERFGDGAVTYKLANQRPKFCVREGLPGIPRDQLIAACVEAFGRWSAVCDLIFTPTDDPHAAQFVIFAHQFDGQSGVLADCQLPSPGLTPQDMRLDLSERWIVSDVPPPGRINLVAVLCHEMGHGIGLQHLPSNPPPDLLEPVYRADINRPQATESAIVQKWYGLPQVVTPPSTPPLGDSLVVDLIITQGTTEYRAQGKANRVA